MNGKIKFIGTGSGKTSTKRFHSSILITYQNFDLLIDAGDGVSRALLISGIDFNSIDAIIVTHFHADHFGGIGSLITQMKLNGRRKELSIYTFKSLTKTLRSFLNSCYMFQEILDFDLVIEGFEYGAEYQLSGEISFIPRENNHIRNRRELNYPEEIFSSASLIINVGENAIFYTADIGVKEDLYLYGEEKISLMISETTHVKIDDIVSSFRSSTAEKLFLTHLDEEHEENISDFIKNLSPEIRDSIIIAEDGWEINLP